MMAPAKGLGGGMSELITDTLELHLPAFKGCCCCSEAAARLLAVGVEGKPVPAEAPRVAELC